MLRICRQRLHEMRRGFGQLLTMIIVIANKNQISIRQNVELARPQPPQSKDSQTLRATGDPVRSRNRILRSRRVSAK